MLEILLAVCKVNVYYLQVLLLRLLQSHLKQQMAGKTLIFVFTMALVKRWTDH